MNLYMKQLVIILTFLLVCSQIFAQKIYWSDFTPEDKKKALDISSQFYSYIANSQTDNLLKNLSPNNIYIGEDSWIKTNDFADEIFSHKKDGDFNDLKMEGFIFEDFLNSYSENRVIKEVYKVFDNHSVVVSVTYMVQGKIKENLLILKRKRDGYWQITGLIGLLDAKKYRSTESDLSSKMKVEKVTSFGVKMPVPRNFIGPEIINDQTFFFFEGNSGRDAVFQIMTDQLTSKLYLYTYKFVEHNNQQFKMSNLVVRYVPAGILIEYEVVDPYGSKNKGITIGMEKNGQVILIQYYSFIDVYSKINKLVKYTFNHIKL